MPQLCSGEKKFKDSERISQKGAVNCTLWYLRVYVKAGNQETSANVRKEDRKQWEFHLQEKKEKQAGAELCQVCLGQ